MLLQNGYVDMLLQNLASEDINMDDSIRLFTLQIPFKGKS